MTTTENVSGALVGGQNFDEQPVVVTVIFLVIGVVGTVGNALVCLVIASTLAWSKGGTTNLLILNQAAVDTLTSLILILTYTLPNPDVPTIGSWAEFICRMWVSKTLLWMLFVVSTFNLCTMSLERYCAVAYPVLYSTRFNKRMAVVMILFSWIVAPLLHYYYPIAFDYNNAGTCANHGKTVVVAAVGVMLFTWEFFIPFTIMAVLYTRIVYLLRLQQRRVRVAHVNPGTDAALHPSAPSRIHFEQTEDAASTSIINDVVSTSRPTAGCGQGNPRGNVAQRRPRAPSETVRRNVTITLLAVFIMYGICWMPNHVTFLQFGLGGPLDLTGGWYYFTLILSYLNMSINPFIYALKYKIFKEGCRRLFCNRSSPCCRRGVVGSNTHERLPQRSVHTISGSDRS
ncbi:histamine H2 receptor-like [Diadema antillarum]|uniref:histamine H2 receptor-like n=1 Tax=Diadema antillarum TaxID=105358 RepID=UPI003A8B6F61